MVTPRKTSGPKIVKRFHVQLRDPEEAFWWSYNVPAKSHGHAVEVAKLHMGWGNCQLIAVVKQKDASK